MTENTFTAVDRKTGQVLYAGTAHDPKLLSSNDISIVEGVVHESGYFDGGVHHELPEKPTKYHVFDYAVKQWIDRRTPETERQRVRFVRNQLLTESDWTQLPDVPLSTKEAWAAYRQALRDITEQPDPFNITWPAVPG